MLQVLQGPVIHEGDALSDPLDCSAGAIVKITMPHDWVDAVLTFQTSSDGIGFNDVFDAAGHEVTYVVQAGTGVIGMRLSTGWVKFRSGSRDRPVPQPARREFAVALDVMALPAGGIADNL